MFNNPYCRCGQHLGMYNHSTSEHKYAIAEMEDTNESVMIVSEDTVDAIAEWCGGRTVVEHNAIDYDTTYPAVNVPTVRGVERASEGDQIVKQSDGSFEIVSA